MRALTIGLLLTLAGALPMTSQPVISQGDIFSPGDVFYSLRSLTIPHIGPAGDAILWDFSQITLDTVLRRHDVIEPDTTPNFNFFPASNVGIRTSFNNRVGYAYYHVNDAELALLGKNVGGHFQHLQVNEVPEIRLQFPLTMDTEWSADFEGIIIYTSGDEGVPEGTVEGLVDAWGSLTLPQAEFDDVIRLRYISYLTDTLDVGSGLSERVRIRDTSYIFLSPSYPGPLCIWTHQVDSITGYFMTPDTLIYSTDVFRATTFFIDPVAGTSSSVREDFTHGTFGLTIAPNPFAERIEVAFVLEQQGDVRFEVMDLFGNVRFSEAMRLNAGEHQIQFLVPELSSGYYFGVLRNTHGAAVQKLIRIGAGR